VRGGAGRRWRELGWDLGGLWFLCRLSGEGKGKDSTRDASLSGKRMDEEGGRDKIVRWVEERKARLEAVQNAAMGGSQATMAHFLYEKKKGDGELRGIT